MSTIYVHRGDTPTVGWSSDDMDHVLDFLWRQPERGRWKHPDPEVRADAYLHCVAGWGSSSGPDRPSLAVDKRGVLVGRLDREIALVPWSAIDEVFAPEGQATLF